MILSNCIYLLRNTNLLYYKIDLPRINSDFKLSDFFFDQVFSMLDHGPSAALFRLFAIFKQYFYFFENGNTYLKK